MRMTGMRMTGLILLIGLGLCAGCRSTGSTRQSTYTSSNQYHAERMPERRNAYITTIYDNPRGTTVQRIDY